MPKQASWGNIIISVMQNLSPVSAAGSPTDLWAVPPLPNLWW